MEQRGDRLYTSVFTLGETLVGVRKHGNTQVEDEIRNLFLSSNSAITLLPFSIDVADRYATIRATTRIEPPDAIHLATAAVEGVDMFLTNDRSLARKTIPGIGFISDLSSAPF
jgi:predicted nucleic acid-binding protein